MHASRQWGWLLMWVGSALAAPVPPVLEPWQDWVLHGHEDRRCPAHAGSEETACAWPGELRIEADAGGARFTQRWTVYSRQAVPLPGDGGEFRPVDVVVDGQPAPVTLGEGQPAVELEPGSYALGGRIAWRARPPTLPLPASIAWVTLRVDGEDIAVPQRDEAGNLVLGATGSAEGDAMQLEVYRLLADGTPPWLATRIEFSVAGKPREQVIGPILPPGFVPVALDGEVPMRWESDGRLRLQLRPGNASITVIARAPSTATKFAMPAVPEPWVLQEIWQFRVAPEWRIAQLEGVLGVDPAQADVPNWLEGVGEDTAARWGWMLGSQALPTFVLEHDVQATLAASLRGLPASRPPRLSLSRQMWLSFDGDEFLARDTLSGNVGSAQRFDMRAPWQLEAATHEANQNLLITKGPAAGSSGFEWRDEQLQVSTGARVPRDSALPASGWAQPFDSASAALHLPPGYRLFGAAGVDRAEDSWVDRWTLLDLFLASMTLLLAWRTKIAPLAVALLGWLLWGWHEPDAPRLTLLIALGLALILRYVPAGRWQRVLAWTQRAVLALVVFWSLFFAATQLRLAIFPQLEYAGVSGEYGDHGVYESTGFEREQPILEVPASAPAPPARNQSKSLDNIMVTGSRMKRIDLFKYPTDTITQAGRARPEWRLRTYELHWKGPLLPDETLALWISPPWLTALLRVASVLLFGFALLTLARRVVPALPRVAAPAPLVAAAQSMLLFAVALMVPSLARAQATPDSQVLDTLRERLLQSSTECHPHCASLATVDVRRNGASVVLRLQAHAQEQLAWPLPWPAEAPVLASVHVDGEAAKPLRSPEGAWVVLERGVHRVEVEFAGADGRWRIEFPLPPAQVTISDATLETSGVDEQRLSGGTLELIATQSADAQTGVAPADAGEAIPPFVRVRRHLTIDQQWRLDTTVERIAPARGGLTVPVRLLPGELALENAPPVREGVAQVSIPAGADSVRWTSRLTPAGTFALLATESSHYSEEWLLDVASLLHVEPGGVPESASQNEGTRRFLPLPGETLTLMVTRPVAVDGATLAIESVRLRVTPGQRARDSRLQMSLRSTRAGQHWLALPPDSELLGLDIDGVGQPRVLDKGRVALPLRTVPQNIVVSWREPIGVDLRIRSPELELGAAAGNLRIELEVPQDRWLLAAAGPGVGPALLYWPQLALLVIVAWGLARVKLTPLRFHHWLLLGLGFSTVSWLAAAIVAGWLLLLGWRARFETTPRHLGFPLLQATLVLATFVALLCLVAAVPTGLLGTPDMQVAGNASYAGLLNWYLDATDARLPAATAWSLPMWAYKVAILAWALWLANALIGWLRWGWEAFSRGGRWYWPRRAPKPLPPA